MIKWLLSCLLFLSIILNMLLWFLLFGQEKTKMSSALKQGITEVQQCDCATTVTADKLEIQLNDLQVNKKTQHSQNKEAVDKYINQLNQSAKLNNWEVMLDLMQGFSIDDLSEDEIFTVDNQVSQIWLSFLQANQSNSNSLFWVEAMDYYITRKPEDLNVGFFYLQYLVNDNRFEEALLYVNYLMQLNTDDALTSHLKIKFDNLVLQTITDLRESNENTRALSFLNIVLQYEVFNIPLLIQKTQLQIQVGDYQGAGETLTQFEYDLAYETQIDVLRSQINNAPKDRSIKLQVYGGQYIVNTLFDDGFAENSIPLLIDTGASISVINEEIFNRYVNSVNVGFLRNISVDTAGGKIQAKLYEIERIKIGEFEVLNTQFMVIAMANDKPYKGLLGMSFLRYFEFNIDQKTAKLHLKPN